MKKYNFDSDFSWRTIVASRYGDGPDDARVGNVYANLPQSTRNKLAVLFDYKGNLEVIWKATPSTAERVAVEQRWAAEFEYIVNHYVLSHIGANDEDDCGLWKTR